MSDKVKLFLKAAVSEGKRIRRVDPVSGAVDYKNEVRLFPHRATLVSPGLAEDLLRQDPHLVSKEPFRGVENDKDGFLAEDDSVPTLVLAEVSRPVETTNELIQSTLAELAQTETDKLTGKKCEESLLNLGFELIEPQAHKVAEKRALLEQACEKVV